MILRVKMVFKSLAVILKENKLIGPNYIDWKINLDIVLTAKEYKFVLIKVFLQQLGEGETDEKTQAYQKWKKAYEMTRCYILAYISNIL